MLNFRYEATGLKARDVSSAWAKATCGVTGSASPSSVRQTFCSAGTVRTAWPSEKDSKAADGYNA